MVQICIGSYLVLSLLTFLLLWRALAMGRQSDEVQAPTSKSAKPKEEELYPATLRLYPEFLPKKVKRRRIL